MRISTLCEQNTGADLCVSLGTQAAEIVERLNDGGCGAVFVLSESQHLIGIITDGDIRRALSDNASISSVNAEELMSHGPITVTPEVSIVDAHRLMLINEVNVLPVIELDGTYLSYVQLMDFQCHLSPERIYPTGPNKSDESNERRHFARYEFAMSFIARALIKNPEILILDEATASLDSDSEKKVHEAINNLVKDRTVIVIAHRLSTIVNSNKILVFSKGKIVDQGTHEDLLKNSEKYKKLYDLQAGN